MRASLLLNGAELSQHQQFLALHILAHAANRGRYRWLQHIQAYQHHRYGNIEYFLA